MARYRLVKTTDIKGYSIYNVEKGYLWGLFWCWEYGDALKEGAIYYMHRAARGVKEKREIISSIP